MHRAVNASDALAEKGYHVRALNISCLTDPDVEALRAAAETGTIVTYEDHNVRTGLGSIVANVLAENGLTVKFRKMGVSAYGSSGKSDALFDEQGLGVESLVSTVESLVESS